MILGQLGDCGRYTMRGERATTEVSRSFDKIGIAISIVSRSISKPYACEMQSPKWEAVATQLGDRGRYACVRLAHVPRTLTILKPVMAELRPPTVRGAAPVVL